MLDEIIRIFREKNGFVSGEEISRRLGVTRAAVWKKVNALRRKGYDIKASTAKGYKLLKTPEFSVEELKSLVEGEIGRDIIFFEKIDSTNRTAVELAEKGAPHGTVIIADSQTKGRGRLGRTWSSPPGCNIYMSIILRPELEPRDATLLTIMAAVACADAIRESAGLRVKIKWPNDLMVSGKKLGGILTEMKSDPDRIVFAVAGIGINVNIRVNSFSPDVRPIATSVKEETGRHQSRTLIVAGILREITRWYKTTLKSGGRPLLERWKLLSSTLGKKVRVVAGKDVFSGIAEDIDEEGMLIMRLSSGILKKISAGDLTVLR